MIARHLTVGVAFLLTLGPVRAPAGHRIAMDTWGVGEITYECREKKDAVGQFEWAFVAPVATLYDGQKKVVGKYYGGPTWESNDGSKVTGKQVAVAPAPAPWSIPLQLVKAEPAMFAGARGLTCATGSGSSWMMAASVCAPVPLWNARLPVAIS